MGQQLVDPRVTIVDDGTLPRETSSVPFDREGVPTRRNVLVDKGVASELLLDLQTATTK
jgi:predicted Zn-dependent protease